MITGDVIRSKQWSWCTQTIASCIAVVFILLVRHISPVLGMTDKAYSCQEIHQQLESVKRLLGEQAHIDPVFVITPLAILSGLVLIKMMIDWLRWRRLVKHLKWWEEAYVGNEEKNFTYLDFPDDVDDEKKESRSPIESGNDKFG